MFSRLKFSITVSLLILLVFQSVFAEVDSDTSSDGQAEYSTGLAAYINNDHVLAQQSWLKAAKQSNAKAMFNLGLLHQEQLIPAANAQKAANWFMLAGKYGYPAAYYHYANLLLEKGELAEAERLIKQAADQGYQPAIVKLSRNTTFDKVVSSSKPKENHVMADYEQWVKSQSSSNWTIQLVAYPELSKIQAFIKQHGLSNTVYFHDKNGNKNGLYKLIYGSYPSKEQADNARQALPKDLLALGPWLRTLESVQNSIN